MTPTTEDCDALLAANPWAGSIEVTHALGGDRLRIGWIDGAAGTRWTLSPALADRLPAEAVLEVRRIRNFAVCTDAEALERIHAGLLSMEGVADVETTWVSRLGIRFLVRAACGGVLTVTPTGVSDPDRVVGDAGTAIRRGNRIYAEQSPRPLNGLARSLVLHLAATIDVTGYADLIEDHRRHPGGVVFDEHGRPDRIARRETRLPSGIACIRDDDDLLIEHEAKGVAITMGAIRIRGGMPETLATALVGQPLGTVVDLPGLATLPITAVETGQGGATVHFEDDIIGIESAAVLYHSAILK